MRVFETYSDLQTAIDLPALAQGAYRFKPEAYGVAGFVCDCCGAVKVFPCKGVGTGYGVHRDSTGRETMHCYDCCIAADKARMVEAHKAGKPFYCYVSMDGKRASAWPGGELGRVHAFGESRSGWAGSKIARFHVRDVHGQWWQGRGAGTGMACTLRPMKRPTYSQSWGV